jgi:uncharacterized repeat protein (TIGR01451 family)
MDNPSRYTYIFLAVAICFIMMFGTALLLLQTNPVAATTSAYYVHPANGSDATGDGTQANPWRTITYAYSQVGPGDIINLFPGTYSISSGEQFPIEVKPDVQLIGASRNNTFIIGTSETAVLYFNGQTMSYGDSTIIANLTMQNGDSGIAMYASEQNTLSPHIENLRLRWNTNGIHITTGYVYEQGATVTGVISNTQIIANEEAGIYMRAYGYFSPSLVAPTIVNTKFENNGLYGLYLQPSAPSANGSSTAPHIINSEITGSGEHGIYAIGTYKGWANPQIERSWISNNGGFGFYWDQGINGGNLNAAITNTMIAQNNEGGIFLGRRSYYSYDEESRLSLVNSNLVNNQNYGIYWNWVDSEEVTPEIVNSILWNPQAIELYAVDHYGNEPSWTEAYVQHSIIRDSSLAGLNGNLSDNPGFWHSYYLGGCSPAIDAGTAARMPATDIDGKPRPFGSGPDIGVEESQQLCLLESSYRAFSSTQPRWGSLLDYVIVLTNTTSLTMSNVSLTNVLPTGLQLLPDTLWASHGITPTVKLKHVIDWSVDIAPDLVVSLGYMARVTRANVTIDNKAIIATGTHGMYAPVSSVYIPPEYVFLPTVNYRSCSGPIIDDFSDPDSGWPIVETGNVILRYLNGEYNMYHHSSSQWVAVSRGDRWNNSRMVQVEGRIAANEGAWGLIFGLNDNWSDFYTFEIMPNSQFWLVQRYTSAGGWHTLGSGISAAIQPGSAYNTLKIERLAYHPNMIALVVNAHTVYGLAEVSGRVGLTGVSLTPNVDIRYDNYIFVDETCPLPTSHQTWQIDSADFLLLEGAEMNQYVWQPEE